MVKNKLSWYLAQHTEQSYALHVEIGKQQCHVLNRDLQVAQSFAVSTAKNGVSNKLNSNGTPSGLCSIVERIGNDQPMGMRFIGRVPTGEIVRPEADSPENSTIGDYILTRILRLAGLESGINRGGDVDTYARYIYLHGTNEEYLIGTPASHGCIRMRNTDILSLYSLVSCGTPVLISS
ncbi:MAG: L,D-transpeptidase [Porticoccaceae bacterium]|nr:L,D-transpeptidase [Porticoccaceae bacterium]